MARRCLLLAVWLFASACAAEEETLIVFAAASLADVAQAAADLYPDVPARVSVGPTSLLSQQIEQGAPADVFLAAHPIWVERLTRSGRTHSEPVDLARGRLVIVAVSGASPARSAEDALAGATRIATADPSHVPAGQYAEAALKADGTWEHVRERIHPVADVRAALVAVQRCFADAAIIYASDALAADELAVVYRFPRAVTPEIRYVGVAVSSKPEAEAWIRQLGAAEMQPLWTAHGFEPAQP